MSRPLIMLCLRCWVSSAVSRTKEWIFMKLLKKGQKKQIDYILEATLIRF